MKAYVAPSSHTYDDLPWQILLISVAAGLVTTTLLYVTSLSSAGAFVLVSHDIDFINNKCNVIYHLENGELNRYKGNYVKSNFGDYS